MIKVNRGMFICWTEGILMDRDKDGNVIAVDEIRCGEAEKALNRGETIALCDVNWDVVSTLSLKAEGYIEELANSSSSDT
jgi:hypothetical protein